MPKEAVPGWTEGFKPYIDPWLNGGQVVRNRHKLPDGLPLPGGKNNTPTKTAGEQKIDKVLGSVEPDDFLMVAYGRVRVKGTRIWGPETAHGGQPHRTYWALCEGEINSVEGLWVNGHTIAVGNTYDAGLDHTFATMTPYYGQTPQDGAALLPGGVSYLDAKFWDLARGAVIWWYDYFGIPEGATLGFDADIKGIKVHDPRSGSFPNDTPAYSTNPVLIILDLLMNSTYGAATPAAQIDTASFAAMATVADNLSFSCNVVFSKQIKVAEAIDIVRATCGAELTTVGGKVGIFIDSTNAGAAVATFTENENLTKIEHTWGQRPTRVRVRFTNVADGTYGPDEVIVDDPSLAGGDVPLIERTLDLSNAVQDATTAHRIAVFTFNTNAITHRIKGEGAFEGEILARGNKVHVVTEDYEGDCLIDELEMLTPGNYRLSFKPYDADVYSVTPITFDPPDYGPPPDTTPDPLQNATVFGYPATDALDPNVLPVDYVAMAYDPPDPGKAKELVVRVHQYNVLTDWPGGVPPTPLTWDDMATTEWIIPISGNIPPFGDDPQKRFYHAECDYQQYIANFGPVGSGFGPTYETYPTSWHIIVKVRGHNGSMSDPVEFYEIPAAIAIPTPTAAIEVLDLEEADLGTPIVGVDVSAAGRGRLGFDVNDHKLKVSINGGAYSEIGGAVSAEDIYAAIGALEKEPTGFPNRTDSVISFNEGTRKVTIAPAGGLITSFDIYLRGEKATFTTTQEVTIDNTTGTHYVYFSGGYGSPVALTKSMTFWDLSETVPVAAIYWNATDGKGLVFEERHGLVMDWATHQYLHKTQGTRYVSGGGLSSINTQPSVPADTDNDAQIAETVIADEDIETTIAAMTTNAYVVLYRNGASGNWSWKEVSSVPFDRGTYIKYNQYTGATWQLTDADTPKYINYWLLAVPVNTSVMAAKYGFVWVPGQTQHATLAAAQGESFGSLSLGTLPFQEACALWKITWRTGAGYSTTGKVRIEATERINGNVTIVGTGTGTVTSVGMTAPAEIAVTGSPVTGAGVIDIAWATEAANKVFAGPTTGSPAVPTFRSLVKADLPALTGFTVETPTGSVNGSNKTFTLASTLSGDYVVMVDGEILTYTDDYTVSSTTLTIASGRAAPTQWVKVLRSGAENAVVATNPLTTKGDLWGFSTAGDRLPVGADGKVLVADSSLSLGVGYKGGMVQIQKITTASSQATVDFQNIPANFSDLMVVFQCRSNVSSTGETQYVKFNNDGTAANYLISESLQGYSNSSTAFTTAATTGGLGIGAIPGGTTTANYASSGFVVFPNYLGTTFYKEAVASSGFLFGSLTTNYYRNLTSGVWKSTTAISRITFSVPTSYLNGSVFTLYGLGAA